MKDKNWIENWLIYFSTMTLFSLTVLFVTFTNTQNPFVMKMKNAVIAAVFLIIMFSILMFVGAFIKHKQYPGEENEQKDWIKNWLIYFATMALFSLTVLLVTFTNTQNPFVMKMKNAIIAAVFLIIIFSVLMFISVFVKHKRDSEEGEDEQTN